LEAIQRGKPPHLCSSSGYKYFSGNFAKGHQRNVVKCGISSWTSFNSSFADGHYCFVPICWWTLKKIKYSFSVLEEIQRVEKSNLPLLKWGPRLVFPSHLCSPQLLFCLYGPATYSGGGGPATAWPVCKDIELRGRGANSRRGRGEAETEPVPGAAVRRSCGLRPPGGSR